MKSKSIIPINLPVKNYTHLLSGVSTLLEQARTSSVRSVNAIMTVTYWKIGRQIVEYEQHGQKRALYGEALLEQLSGDLTKKFGRGYSRQNVQQMRQFYVLYPLNQIRQTLSGKSKELIAEDLINAFPLSWSHYVRLQTN